MDITAAHEARRILGLLEQAETLTQEAAEAAARLAGDIWHVPFTSMLLGFLACNHARAFADLLAGQYPRGNARTFVVEAADFVRLVEIAGEERSTT